MRRADDAPAGGQRHEPMRRTQQGALAGAVRADQCDAIAARDAKVYVGQRDLAAEPNRRRLKLDQVDAHVCPQVAGYRARPPRG